MSRNSLLAVILLLVIVFALILFSRGKTATQGGFVSPTPAQGTINSDVSPTIAASPSAMEPSISPAGVSPTVQVSVSPTQ